MNYRVRMMHAFDWMLEEAQCYVGCVLEQDPHEAARLIVKYFDELKEVDPEKYARLISLANTSHERE